MATLPPALASSGQMHHTGRTIAVEDFGVTLMQILGSSAFRFSNGGAT